MMGAAGRRVAGVLLVLTIGSVVGCSGSRDTGESSCAGGPILRLASGHTVRLASCAGEIGLDGPAPAVTLRVGQRATLSDLGDGYSAPVSDNPQVVTLHAQGNSADLQAVSAGVTISLVTDFCMGRRSAHCPAITVTVRRP